MIDLNFGNSDFILVYNKQRVSLETVECILSYPKRLGKLDIELDFDETDIERDKIEKMPMKGVYDNIEIGMSATGVEQERRCILRYFINRNK
jgi:hypothetical protein